ncbi:glutathione S-transferase T3-like protein [Tanacetum coccineum]
MSIIPNHETSHRISRNLFEDSQIPRSTEKVTKWETKEDIALMSAWCHVSSDPTRGNNQRKTSMWARICQIYDQIRAENPKDIGPRNENQMKGRFKRLSENGSKWVAAYTAAYSRKTSGMSLKDVELDAHKIYEGDGSKFLDLIVFNEVMCKHPKWKLNLDRDKTRLQEPNEESGGSTKRSRVSEEGDYVVHSNQETPNSGGSSIQRPIGRDAAKKKGKGKASPNNEFVEELRAMRITRESEIEVMNKRLEIDKKREEREIKREERELKQEEMELKK